MTDNNDESLKVLVDTVLRESGFDPLAITNSELYADFHTLAMRAYRLGQLHAAVAPAAVLSPNKPIFTTVTATPRTMASGAMTAAPSGMPDWMAKMTPKESAALSPTSEQENTK